MKNVSRFLTWNHLRLLVLSSFLIVVSAASVLAQYTVGPSGSGATYTTLMDAYAAVQAAGLYSDTTIQIFSGSYIDQPIQLTPITSSSPGATLTIQGSTSNPGDALFRISSSSSSIDYALKVDGASNIEFRNVMFDIDYHASRTKANPVLVTDYSSNINFINCLLEAPVPPPSSSSGAAFAVARLKEFDGILGFYDCIFNDGSMGISAEITPTGSPAELIVKRSTFSEQSETGIESSINFRGSNIELRNNTFLNSQNVIYTGILCDQTTADFEARNNLFVLSNTTTTTGIEASANNVLVKNSLLHLTDCKRLKGVYVHGETNKVEITKTSIYETFPSSGMHSILNEGIVFEGPFPDGFKTQQALLITWNTYQSEAPHFANGIRMNLNGRKIQYLMDISNNKLLYDNLAMYSNGSYSGISLQGNNTEVNKTRVNGNEIRFQKGTSGVFDALNVGISIQDLRRIKFFDFFNNTIELGKQSSPSGRGISLRNIKTPTGMPSLWPVWVGNNMVSVENNSLNLYGIEAEDVDQLRAYHNSVHIFDNEGASALNTSPNVASFYLGESSPGSMSDTKLWNNIWSNDSYGYNMKVTCTSCLLESNKNLFAPFGAFRVLGSGLTSYTTLLSWQGSGSNRDVNSLVGAPMFLANNDLHIQGITASKAWNQGGWLTYPPTDTLLKEDIDGDSRFSSDIPDIGADEVPVSNKWGNASEESLEDAFTVYPNPNNGISWIKGPNAYTLEITNAVGQVIQRSSVNNTNYQIDLRDQAPGIYLLRLQAPNQAVQVRKLVRQ